MVVVVDMRGLDFGFTDWLSLVLRCREHPREEAVSRVPGSCRAGGGIRPRSNK